MQGIIFLRASLVQAHKPLASLNEIEFIGVPAHGLINKVLWRQSDPREVKASLMWPNFALSFSPEFHFDKLHIRLDKRNPGPISNNIGYCVWNTLQ